MHPNYAAIIEALQAKQPFTGPWGAGIKAALEAGTHVDLVAQLTSQANDDCGVMSRIVGVEITELLIGRKLIII